MREAEKQKKPGVTKKSIEAAKKREAQEKLDNIASSLVPDTRISSSLEKQLEPAAPEPVEQAPEDEEDPHPDSQKPAESTEQPSEASSEPSEEEAPKHDSDEDHLIVTA